MNEVEIFLKEKLLAEIYSEEVKERVKKCVEHLTTEGYDSKNKNRLAFSIAIDVKNAHLSPQTIAGIFSNIGFEDIDDPPEFQIERIIRSNKDTLPLGVKHNDLKYPSTQYCTIQNWGKLASKCLIPSGADQYEISYKMFVENKSQPLSRISNWSNYSRKMVWVLPIKEFIEFYKKLENQNLELVEIVEKILDHIGVYNGYSDPTSKLEKYIYIKYPKVIEFDCYQPTTLSCDWTEDDGLYLSFRKSDGFGRTICTCGICKIGAEAKERIHVGTNYVTNEFEVFPLGNPGRIIPKNTDSILLTAKKRYDE